MAENLDYDETCMGNLSKMDINQANNNNNNNNNNNKNKEKIFKPHFISRIKRRFQFTLSVTNVLEIIFECLGSLLDSIDVLI